MFKSFLLGFSYKRPKCTSSKKTSLTLGSPTHKFLSNMIPTILLFFFYNLLFFVLSFIYLFWKRERESESQEGAERRRDRIPRRLHVVKREPNTGLELTTRKIMTRAKIKSQRCLANWATQERLYNSPLSEIVHLAFLNSLSYYENV